MEPPVDGRARPGADSWLQWAESARQRARERRLWAEASRASAASLQREAAEGQRRAATMFAAFSARRSQGTTVGEADAGR
jgi:hypothetical protein